MFEKVLIANRGAIAVRIERTLREMGVRSVAVYAQADRDSLHVENADEAVCLGEGPARDTYLDIDKIIDAAVQTGAQAVHPGYGFLSENTEFAARCEERGIRFIGPAPEQIRLFGLKHSARQIAQQAQVPLLSGTGLLTDVQQAAEAAERIGYPVMIKSTAGGGGIGIRICENRQELLSSFDDVRHLAQNNFGDGGVFVEKYIRRARHVEVQIFGNEEGEVAILGERDCSVQRRNQKVVEESPAPNFPDRVRREMYAAAKRLAKTSGYRSAGTVEFLYDEAAEHFYFLEVNTRLQVEHGITEEVYGIDLVEWMIREAAGELHGIDDFDPIPDGHSIEIRLYAEDAANGFRPSTGKLDEVIFSGKARVETWIRKNIEITSLYDPMLAKLIVHAPDRESAVEKMLQVIEETKIYGVTTNLYYLHSFLSTPAYREGRLFTKMLEGFLPQEPALEVLEGGVQSTVQDAKGMLGYWTVGVPPCGAMDAWDLRIGNALLGNNENAAGIEMTLTGGAYRFRMDADFCLTGADMGATLNGRPVPMYTVVRAGAMQELRLGTCTAGMRTYLLVAGGIDVPQVMGSSSTFCDGKFGGHNGRALRAGDVLHLAGPCRGKFYRIFDSRSLPQIGNEWTIGVLPGPQPTEEFLQPEYLHTLTTAEYTVNFNSARTGIRLNGPIPQWTRTDGGEAGLHPSNIHDDPYAIGTMDLTGDQSILLGPDGPSLGGFVCSVTTARAELWKLGQLHPGDRVHFRLLTLEQAKELKETQERIIVGEAVPYVLPPQQSGIDASYAVLERGVSDGVDFDIRLQGEENVLVEFGEMELSIELRFRVHVLMQQMQKQDLPIIDMTPGIRSLQVHFNADRIGAREMAERVKRVSEHLPALEDITVPSRKIYLPLSWDDPQTQIAAQRYQKTVRPNAPWCPSNPEFIRRINGLESVSDVRDIVFSAEYLVLGLGDVYLGAPVAVPVDPRQRLVTTKYNPARPWTPENAVGIGGAYLCVYGMEGPGGYQFVGRTIQMWNSLRETEYFPAGRPWLLNFFDRICFYPCSAEEILQYRDDFLRGKFPLRVEEGTFHLGEYRRYLKSIEESEKVFKEHQEASFEAERQRWIEQGLDHFDSESAQIVEESEESIPVGCEAVSATIPGSVWKILVSEGEVVDEGDTIAVLESMKMEFAVTTKVAGRVEKIFIRTSQQLDAGAAVAAIRKEESNADTTEADHHVA